MTACGPSAGWGLDGRTSRASDTPWKGPTRSRFLRWTPTNQFSKESVASRCLLTHRRAEAEEVQETEYVFREDLSRSGIQTKKVTVFLRELRIMTFENPACGNRTPALSSAFSAWPIRTTSPNTFEGCGEYTEPQQRPKWWEQTPCMGQPKDTE